MKQKSYLIIALVFIGCLTIASLSLQNDATIPTKNQNISLSYRSKITHTIPENNTIHQTGTEFLQLDGGQLYTIFDNTNVFYDTNNDGIYDHQTTLNANTYTDPSIPYYGSRIYTDKPTIYTMEKYNTNTKRQYLMVPPIHALKNHYYISPGTWYLGATNTIQIQADENLDNSIEQTITISKLNGATITVTNITLLTSTHPFYCYNDYSFIDTPGQDYYLQSLGITQLYVFNDTTNLSIDTDNDGNYDEFINLNTGFHTLTGYTRGAHLHANKTILIQDDYLYKTAYIAPSNTLSSDYYLIRRPGGYTNLRCLYISSFNNVTIYMDKTHENDLQDNWNFTIGSTENITFNMGSESSTHVWSTKPIISLPFSHYSRYGSNIYYYYNRATPSCITSMTYHTPNELRANQNVQLENRIFNPTATTNITNITANFTINDAFSLLGGTNLNINITKKYLDNDTQIATDTFTITPQYHNNNYTFQLTKTETNLLSSLKPMQYYSITYEIITPTTVGNYQFPPVTIEYDSSTWILPN